MSTTLRLLLVLGAVPLIEISLSRNAKELCLKFLQGWCRTDQHWTLCDEPNMTKKNIVFSNSNCSNSLYTDNDNDSGSNSNGYSDS